MTLPIRWPSVFLVAVAVGGGTLYTPPAPAAPRPGNKRALLIAVSDYQAKYKSRKSLYWANLHTYLDVANTRQVLREKYGFPDADILTLQNRDATRQGILDSFHAHLIEPAQPGDAVLFMFSGHGQQLRDDNGDDDEADGLDESFIPYDYVSGRAPDNARVNIRDDDLQKLLKELAEKMRGPDRKVQGNITVVIDSCHSGTIVRGSQVTKGRAWDEAIDGPRPQPRGPIRGGKGDPAEGPVGPEGSGLIAPGEALAQGYVLFAACESQESAFEVEDEKGHSMGGVLVYNLCRALRDATPRMTYRDLFERVKLDVKALRTTQTPSMEGEIDQLLFSGVARPSPAYPVVEAYKGGEATIGAGRLHGVTAKSRYALYKAGSDTTNPVNRLTEVTISQVDAFRSWAALPKSEQSKLAEKDLLAAKAVLTAQYYGDEKLRVLLEGTGQLAAALKDSGVPAAEDALQLLPTEAPPSGARVSRGDAGTGHVVPSRRRYDIRITRELPQPSAKGEAGTERVLVLRRDDDTVVGEVPEDALAGARLRERLLGLWRWRFLSQLRPRGAAARFQVEIRVVPVEVKQEGGRIRVLGDRKDGDRGTGTRVLRGGDYVQVELENKGAETAYVTVFNLQPNGTIAPIFPHPRAPVVVENRIPGGATLRVPGTFVIQPPFGTDVFKVIATPEKIDFTPLLYQAESLPRGERDQVAARAKAAAKGAQGQAGPLARLLLTASTGRRDAAMAPEVDPEYWGAASVTVETRAP